MISEEQQKQLIKLGAKPLANALAELAISYPAVQDLIERLLSNSDENVIRVKTKISKLYQLEDYFPWNATSEFILELESILEDLKAASPEPKVAIELLASFYQADEVAFEHCDDSFGEVGYVYDELAANLFSFYANQCEEKDWLIETVFNLYEESSYNDRICLIKRFSEYLPHKKLKTLAEELFLQVKQGNHKSPKKDWLSVIQLIAKQLKDGHLFELATLYNETNPSSRSFLKIAQVYLDCGDAKQALQSLNRIKETEPCPYGKEDLLLEVYKKLGDTQNQQKILEKRFHEYPSKNTLDKLLEVVGEEKRSEFVNEKIQIFLNESSFCDSHAMFLSEVDCINETEEYLLKHKKEVKKGFSSELLSLAEIMEEHSRFFVATILYRALIDSNLREAKSKRYHHAVHYLKKLAGVSKNLKDWKDIDSHQDYFKELKEFHGRKYSFWSQYEEATKGEK